MTDEPFCSLITLMNQLSLFKEWLWQNKKPIGLFAVGLIFGFWLNGKISNPITPLITSSPLIGSLNNAGLSPETGIGGGSALEKSTTDQTTTTASGSASSRLIIKTGVLSLLVKDVKAGITQIGGLAETLGGYISSSSVSIIDETKNKLTATIVIRIPAEKYSQAFEAIKKTAIKTTNESSSGEDVTEQYTDLDSRLKNLEGAETQLLGIMKNAKETKDVLSVFTELTNIRGQIEQIKGQMQYLEQSGKLATITAYLATEENELPIVEKKWTPLTPLKEGLRALVSFWQNVADGSIYWLVFASPFAALLLVFAIWRLVKRFAPRR